MYLLDTAALSEPRKRTPSPGLMRFVDTQPHYVLHTSVIVIGELWKGVASHPDAQQRDNLSRWITQRVMPQVTDRVLPVTSEIADAWGNLCGEAARRGQNLPEVDALIAATALVHGLTVVTRNERHFRACSVAVLNPWV